jgi:hypothetical protein
MPPVLILILRQLETHMTRNEVLSKALSVIIFLTFGYSLAVSYGDFLFAETYRRSAAEICTEFAGSEKQIFFTGEWGFRYYMKKNGARPISKTGLEAAPGDLLVKPYVALPWTTLYDGDHYSRLLQQRVIQLAYPVRILDFASRAGFYSTGWGLLPVSLAVEEKWEWFNVYEITRQYDGEIPEQEIPY